MTVGVPRVFATVGRARREVDAQILGAVEPSVGLYLQLLGRELLGDVSDGSSFELGESLSVPSEIVVKVAGGTPGQVVPLSLDSYRLPAYLPAHHYTFDALAEAPEGATADDLLETAPAHLGPGVSVDTLEHAEGGASFSFSLEGDPETRGLTVDAAQSLTPAGSFGISGYVRLEAAEGQTLIAKEGAYAITVVAEGGEAYLEFAVWNGGVRKSVRSAQPLPVGAWQHFSGRLENGAIAPRGGGPGEGRRSGAGAGRDRYTSAHRIVVHRPFGRTGVLRFDTHAGGGVRGGWGLRGWWDAHGGHARRAG